MELTVTRRWLDDASTIGELALDGVFAAFTLELPQGRCIPLGRYLVTIERSPRFSMLAGHDVFKPRLHDVPGFEGVLIHEGNTPADTEGCILVGQSRVQDEILQSRAAFGALFPKLQAAQEPIYITVTQGTP